MQNNRRDHTPLITIPVPMTLELNPDEHAEWLKSARAVGVPIEQWIVERVREVAR